MVIQKSQAKILNGEESKEGETLLKDQNITVENVAKLLSVAPFTLYRHIPGGRGSLVVEM